MAHLDSTDSPSPRRISEQELVGPPAKSRWWLWLLIAAVFVIGFWYWRGSHSNAEAENSKNPQAGGAPGAQGGAGGSGGAKGGKGAAGGGMPAVPVVVATAQKGDLPVYFTGLGTVTAFNTVTVHSRVDGQLVKVNFTEGQIVKAGETLEEIDPRPFSVVLEQAQGNLAKDVAQRKDAQTNLERYKLLFGEGVIPKQQMDTQQAQVGQFDGSIAADQGAIDSAKLQLSFTHVTAPLTGRVGLRLVDVGNMVHAADAGGLVVITQLQPISVIFSLPQDQLPQVATKLHNGGQLPVDAFDRDNTTKITSGVLASIDNQIDTTTGTYRLKARFTNENNALYPNQFVNMHLLVDTKKNLIIVPTAAIQRGPNSSTYVYVVDSTNTVKIHNVTISQATDNQVGLTDGINGGDVVVIDGADKLQDGSKVTPSQAANNGKPAASNTNQPQQPPQPNQQQQPQNQSGYKGKGKKQ
jgi:membrane fusion protein, multidrug efflux system